MKTTSSAQHAPHALTAAAHGSVGVVTTQYMHFDEPLPLVSGQTLEAYAKIASPSWDGELSLWAGCGNRWAKT
jgi:hypothetical protein